MASKKLKMNRNILLLTLDAILLGGFWLVNQVKLTGIAFHEWFGIALGLILLVHLGMHWKWVVNMVKNFFRMNNLMQPIKLILDIAGFAAFFTIIISGILMSRSVLPTLGLASMHSHTLKLLHVTATRVSIYIVGAHLLLNLKTIYKMVGRLFHQARKPAEREILQPE